MDLSYPIGKFARPESISAEDRERSLGDLAAAPAMLRQAVQGLDDRQLDTPYRPGGWTVRQVVHHVADSHINSYCRFRFALTEDAPAVKSYDEATWANLYDARSLPVEPSLALLENLHARWVALLSNLSETDWKRTFRHPQLGSVTLDTNLALYAWHGRHHTAHITGLRSRNGW